MENLKDAADTQEGFVIDYRKTVFNGLCAACAKVNTTA
jgi:Fe2+ or Zn2+ uptake regulation protein